MFAQLLAALIAFASAGVLLYFSARTRLLLRANDSHIATTLDGDLKSGWRVWLAIRSLISPMNLVSIS